LPDAPNQQADNKRCGHRPWHSLHCNLLGHQEQGRRSVKLLCVGDIHLGRQPSRLSPMLLEQLPARTLGPAEAWQRCVAQAIERKVDAVLLAGDVVEQNNDFYEAYADLQAGIEQLQRAGISVLGVAGNHDVEVLPRLAYNLPDFILLGRDGHWQAQRIESAAGHKVDILGWSFPRQRVIESPLAAGLPARGEHYTIGLLHCDRDQSGSHYAPVSSAELAAAGLDAWLLGHIHKPDALSGPRPMGYLGAITGLNPKDIGARGPWLLELSTPSEARIEQLPLAPLRWEEIEVGLDNLEQAGNIHSLIIRALRERHAAISEAGASPRAVGCRLLLRGRTALRREIEVELRDTDPRNDIQRFDEVCWFIHDWRLQAAPALDLEELAGASDPAGLLARKLLILRGEHSDERQALIGAAQQQLALVADHRHFAALEQNSLDSDQTATRLESAALRALDELLKQREARP